MPIYYDPYEARHSGIVPEFMPLTEYADYIHPDISPISLGQAGRVGMSAESAEKTGSAVPEVGNVESEFYVADDGSQTVWGAKTATGTFFGPGVSGSGESTESGEDYGDTPVSALWDAGRQGSGTVGTSVVSEEQTVEPKKETPWLLIGAGLVALVLILK